MLFDIRIIIVLRVTVVDISLENVFTVSSTCELLLSRKNCKSSAWKRKKNILYTTFLGKAEKQWSLHDLRDHWPP